MRHLIFQEANSYSIAVLVKGTSFNKSELRFNYVDPLVKRGLAEQEMIAFTLKYNPDGKAPVTVIKEYLGNLLPALDQLGVKHLYVADASYFKTLTGQTKAEPHYGYVLPCKIKGYEHMSVVLGLNYQQLIYNPSLQQKLDLSLHALASGVSGNYQAIGTNIIHSAQYPETVSDIAAALQSLHQYPDLTCDIEGFSLAFNEAGIGTISFAWDKHNGLAFACDYLTTSIGLEPDVPDALGQYGVQVANREVRALLLKFFQQYKGELTFHNAPYDVKAIIHALWMTDLLDTVGLLEGLDIMTARMNDTKIIAYLATNSTAGNVLGLKPLAHEFAGNWAKDDIKDIRKIPLKELLEYNLIDALSTHYVKEKFWPIMVKDNQLDLYRSLMLPSLKLIIQIELSGMPMNDKKIAEVHLALYDEQQAHLTAIKNSSVIKMLQLLLQETAWNKDYEDRKAKAKNPGKILPKNKTAFEAMEFNPNSGPQLQRLLYELMGLPVLDLTDTKQPATGAETIEKLINHTEEPAYKELLNALIGYGKVTKILSTFIPAFERGILKEDGMRYLHGSFNLGGTVSGRLSSSDPNMQNLPAGSDFGKVIKTCFQAPEGWLFAGADFNSLEAMIDALTTQDPKKMGVYTDGYDSHSYNAFTYWPEKMPDISSDIAKAETSISFCLVEYSDGTKEYIAQ
jgi:DNA polymerase-1